VKLVDQALVGTQGEVSGKLKQPPFPERFHALYDADCSFQKAVVQQEEFGV
jgi:hypothetical protein